VASPKRWAHVRRFRLFPGRAIALAAAALAIAGCTAAPAGTGGATATSAESSGSAVPALTLAQARQVFNTYVATTARAARTNDYPLALSVVTGAQRSLIGAQLKLTTPIRVVPVPSPGGAPFSGSGYFYAKPDIGGYTYGPPAFLLPEAAGYPHFFVAAVTRTFKGTTPGDGAALSEGGVRVPLDGRALMLFEQASAAAPWLLASTSQLASAATLPRLAADKNGYVPQVPLSSTSLLARPDVTGPLQAAVVDDGPASAAANAVAAGPLTTGLYQAARDHAQGLTAPRGDIYQWNLEGSPFPAFALRTASGGALVLYAMYLNSVAAVPDVINKASPIRPGLPIQVPPNFLPLLAKGTAAPTESLEDQDLLSFAAIDPPAPPAKVTVIAIGGGANYATAR
jgi:hypothetical protein